MARRKLHGSLTEDEHDGAIINGHKAEESMEDIYHTIRERLGARHPLTLKSRRCNEASECSPQQVQQYGV